jgi:hypothetical protein
MCPYVANCAELEEDVGEYRGGGRGQQAQRPGEDARAET